MESEKNIDVWDVAIAQYHSAALRCLVLYFLSSVFDALCSSVEHICSVIVWNNSNNKNKPRAFLKKIP